MRLVPEYCGSRGEFSTQFVALCFLVLALPTLAKCRSSLLLLFTSMAMDAVERLQPGRLYQVCADAGTHPDAMAAMLHFAKHNIKIVPKGSLVVAHTDSPEDGWAKVVLVHPRAHAQYRHSIWLHPACLQLVKGPLTVEVKRELPTGRLPADYWPTRQQKRGTWDGDALDCRWDRRLWEHNDYKREGHSNQHTGECAFVTLQILTDCDRLADILKAAQWPWVLTCFCHHGKHRSLAAAKILQVLTGSRVEREYCRGWCSGCRQLNADMLVECLLYGNDWVERRYHLRPSA